MVPLEEFDILHVELERLEGREVEEVGEGVRGPMLWIFVVGRVVLEKVQKGGSGRMEAD